MSSLPINSLSRAARSNTHSPLELTSTRSPSVMPSKAFSLHFISRTNSFSSTCAGSGCCALAMAFLLTELPL
eukprot:CAMPEP_0172046602 /NCGR_PEP_ID=MMETSP1043-20130122/524_1 /TAXON_ID=464988 /ORGANISM="Hemiselmis andersenii, Strain CCMP441" /LENGTH=71 /DNA_ID=CAMNT_0012705323 /DNA_START=842 /DNA_END=1057 /DNA_ORIENTATION=-